MMRSLGEAVRGAWRRFGGASLPERPVLVTGNPKSGTTAIAMLLGAATGKTVASDPLQKLEARGLDVREDLYEGKTPIAELLERHPKVFAAEILKDPGFVFCAPGLLARFPASPFVYVVRDPRDNLRSILDRCGIPGDAPSVEPWLDGLPAAWQGALLGSSPRVAGADHVERLAHRWNLGVDAYLAHRDRMRLVRYEDFARDKAGVIRTLAEAVGARARHELGDRVDVQFQPAGRRSVPWGEVFGEARLRRIEEICAARMRQFGYAPRAA